MTNIHSHIASIFQNAFDHNEAQKEGRILPTTGTDADYDEAMDNLKAIEGELKEYLKSQCAYFGCKVSTRSWGFIFFLQRIHISDQTFLQVSYFGSDKKRYQLEVPDHASKRAKSGYELQSQRKGYKRYVTTETKVRPVLLQGCQLKFSKKKLKIKNKCYFME